MADVPRFGQERIANVPALNLLDALLAQGIPQEYLRKLIGLPTPEITSIFLRDDMDRYALDRAVRMAQGEELGKLSKVTDEFERLRIGLEMRGVTVGDYRGARDVQELARWASTHANPQALGNALATVLPNYRNLGGFGVTDQHRQSVTLFSNPQTAPPPTAPATTGQMGVRGQGGMGGGTDQGPGAPTISGTTAGAGAAGGAGGGAGPGAGASPVARPATPEQIRADIERSYGWGAALMDIPEVAAILNRVGSGPGQINAEEADRLFRGTNYYKTTTTTQRQWKVLQGTNPGDAVAQLQGQIDSIRAKAQAQGITVDEARLRQIAEVSKANGWSDQQINAALASEVKWDPNGTKTGTMALLKQAQQSQLVPLSDQAMGQWATAVVSGAKTVDDFQAYLKDQAKSLFPSMANYLDTTPGGTVKQYLDPYAQTIGKTMGMNPAEIDWQDPKYFRFVNNVDPKTGERRVMDLADVSRTLIADPQYGYDKTSNGKQQKAGLARTILEQWGFVPSGSGASQGGF